MSPPRNGREQPQRDLQALAMALAALLASVWLKRTNGPR